MSEYAMTEYEAVRQAVLDYVEGVYEGNPTRIRKSVHPDLVKGGFFAVDAIYQFTAMTFTEFVELAKNYNKDDRIPSDAPRNVVVYDILDQIASAKLIAWWGTDYMHLAKYDGKWMIVQVLWQTHPTQNDRLAKIEDYQGQSSR